MRTGTPGARWHSACVSCGAMSSAAKKPFQRATEPPALAVHGERPSPLRQRLKKETAALHRHLEAQLRLLDPALSLERYRRVLETFYGFYVPVEANLVPLAAVGCPLSFPLRARSELLEIDLL